MYVGIVIARPSLKQENFDVRVGRESIGSYTAANATANHDVIEFTRLLRSHRIPPH
jgi:hypothetical protein